MTLRIRSRPEERECLVNIYRLNIISREVQEAST